MTRLVLPPPQYVQILLSGQEQWQERLGWHRLASPVMAYLSPSASICSAPEHLSGLRAVGRGRGGVDLVATVPLVKAGVQ
ncbi:hypothetical protein PBY51_010190 [Eleginops maclovinus]|uniref:Uncharacterized protein n=1 Tax=Eleginops maclovinus TaxID=56733 RepID=A0AAN7X7B5_ELEMC|nr:hypothetical protein PBY51_010190 [Eleginops maclovinus]